MIVVIDYGMGNVGSVLNMLKKIGAYARLSDRISDIESADHLILPGVGAFDEGMKHLRGQGLIPALENAALVRKTPFLGICLGMQLLMEKSEEGTERGLGWIAGETVRFRFEPGSRLRVPHMGWNGVHIKTESELFAGFEQPLRFYFSQSYHVACTDPGDVAGTTTYGHDFTSVLRHENLHGTQFHPEKSHRFGMQLLRNFAALTPGAGRPLKPAAASQVC